MNWYTIPLNGVRTADIRARLLAAEFVEEGRSFRDRAAREVVVEDACVRIGLPKTDAVDEQEQLEFIVAGLRLDADEAQKV